MAEEKKSSQKTIIILLLIVIILLIAGGAVFFILNANKGNGETSDATSGGKQIPLEVNAQVLDPERLSNWNEKELAAMEDNQIPIIYSPVVNSKDGETFACQIGNPAGAKYYIYLDMYSDTTLEEEIYLSGLLAPGQGITSFKTSKKFPEGETDVVLVITTVQEDRNTIVAQTMVALTLYVQ